MSEFYVDQRVRCVTESDGNAATLEATGRVVYIDDFEVGVEFDSDINGHDCGGHTEYGRGWWVHASNLEPIEYEDDDISENQIDILFNDIMFK